MSTTDLMMQHINGFHFVELKPEVRAHGSQFGIQLDVTVLMARENEGAEDNEELTVHLGFNAVPGLFKPEVAIFEFTDGSKWQWAAARHAFDLEAPEPPQFFKDLVLRVTQELAIQGLGTTYRDAKSHADAAYKVQVADGFGDV